VYILFERKQVSKGKKLKRNNNLFETISKAYVNNSLSDECWKETYQEGARNFITEIYL